MDLNNPKDLEKLVLVFNVSSIGRALSLLVDFAEIGAETLRNSDGSGFIDGAQKDHDPLYTQKEAARYLGIAVKTLQNSWRKRYNIQTIGEPGKSIRYELSELNRVKEDIRKLKE